MHLWINELDCSRSSCTFVDSIIYVSFDFIMKCRVSEAPSTSWHRTRYPPKSISERDMSLAEILRSLCLVFGVCIFFFFFFFFVHYLSSIIRNTQFRRLTKPPSYQPRPASLPTLLSSRFCFRDLLIWLNPTAPLRFPPFDIADSSKEFGGKFGSVELEISSYKILRICQTKSNAITEVWSD